jgi:hypothetical protein
MPCMASSKNRPKKSQRRKKAVSQPKKKTGSAISNTSNTDDPIHQDIPAEIHEPGSGTGAMGKMRGLISGAEPVKEGFFTRRRTLGEWLLWLAAGAALYYAYRFLNAGE